jgi:hypothetical protein
MSIPYPFESAPEYIDVPAWGSDFLLGYVKIQEGGKVKDVQKGVTYEDFQYDNIVDAFYQGFLEFCNCGYPKDEQKLILRVLSRIFFRSYQNELDLTSEERVKLWSRNTDKLSLVFGKNPLFKHHYLQWLDSQGFLEHGGTVFGSWLSCGGISVLKMLIQNRYLIFPRGT